MYISVNYGVNEKSQPCCYPFRSPAKRRWPRRTAHGLQWQPHDGTQPVRRVGCFGEQFQILNALADGNLHGVREYQAKKGAALPLPIFCQSLETNVMSYERAT